MNNKADNQYTKELEGQFAQRKDALMSESKFTPGPWTFKAVPVWTPPQPTDGIPNFQCNENGGDMWLKEAKANARLMATAPEMLEALHRLLRQYEIVAPNYMNVEAVNNAKVTIAKAEGK